MMDGRTARLDGWVDGGMDRWVGGWILGGWMGGWGMDGWKAVC